MIKYLRFCVGMLLIVGSTLLTGNKSYAQGNRGNDTSYYVYFPESITARLYSSRKYTSFYIKSDKAKDLHYTPNTHLNFGVGATYHNFSLNVAYGGADAAKGKTKYLDLQGHFYKPNSVTDFYGQFYKQYHLEPEGFAAPAGYYYYRPDVKLTLIGLSHYRIFNPKRFSYRAAIIQNEWQKKSAGTFLAGAEAYYSTVKGDSSLVPNSIKNNYSEAGINKINYFSIGPGIGYAYNLVLFQHLYVMGSITGNLNFSFATQHYNDFTGQDKNKKFSVNPVTRFRIAAGYGGSVWNISANWIADDLPFKGALSDDKYEFHTGNYRFIIARRFNTGERLRRKLKPVGVIFKE